ncbi:MAG TPA: phosphatidylserine decarboxylase family protein [Chitinophagales bacterium]|nr:phosphatidylserine decarboxylase family protein [Chitinophagales bacterium]
MRIHREGNRTLLFVLAFLVLLNALLYLWLPEPFLLVLALISAVFFLFIVSFFRVPTRKHTDDVYSIVAPADGKVVVIEKTYEDEYLKKDCLQISVFMSPANVHVNRYPMSGMVQYMKYHSGKYLVAWHPKSSVENERTTVVVQNDDFSILVRQIAGKLARRIVCYAKPGQVVKQNEEMGFIKFGSRVDVFLPTDAVVQVALGDTVRGGVTVLAKVKE